MNSRFFPVRSFGCSFPYYFFRPFFTYFGVFGHSSPPFFPCPFMLPLSLPFRVFRFPFPFYPFLRPFSALFYLYSCPFSLPTNFEFSEHSVPFSNIFRVFGFLAKFCFEFFSGFGELFLSFLPTFPSFPVFFPSFFVLFFLSSH